MEFWDVVLAVLIANTLTGAIVMIVFLYALATTGGK